MDGLLIMKIDKHRRGVTEQFAEDITGNQWAVSELIFATKEQGLKIFDIPIQHLCISEKKIGDMTIREFVTRMKQVQKASLDYPIILDEDGAIFDGRHRVVKALLAGNKTIKAVRFDKDPEPTILKN